jgi:hypothetical protein
MELPPPIQPPQQAAPQTLPTHGDIVTYGAASDEKGTELQLQCDIHIPLKGIICVGTFPGRSMPRHTHSQYLSRFIRVVPLRSPIYCRPAR